MRTRLALFSITICSPDLRPFSVIGIHHAVRQSANRSIRESRSAGHPGQMDRMDGLPNFAVNGLRAMMVLWRSALEGAGVW